VRVTHKERGVVDLSTFGDGMRRGAALALALTRARGGVLLVDEIEAGIHTRLLRDVMKVLLEAAREANTQILATTHSLEALDALLDARGLGGKSEDIVAFHLRRSGEKHEVFRYAGDKLQRLRQGGLDIR
jgi:AAA15 family ATPase/GTPase